MLTYSREREGEPKGPMNRTDERYCGLLLPGAMLLDPASRTLGGYFWNNKPTSYCTLKRFEPPP